jgi:glucokinase
VIISIDLGGTKMLATLMDREYQVVDSDKIRTPQTTDGGDILSLMLESIRKLMKSAELGKEDVTGVAVGVPSAVDFKRGIVLSATNIGFEHYPLRDRLTEELGVPVLVENDVNAGLYGEFRRGAGVGKEDIIGLYPGTGIGGAMILDGRLYRGVSGGAGEMGHMIIQSGGRLCGCGRYGCLETLASKTALAKDLVQLAATGKAPSILEKVGSDYTMVKSSHIKKAIEAGEEAVIDLVNRAADFLGIGMANYVNIFNPELIILGGGLIEKLGDRFVARAEASMRANGMPVLLKDVEVAQASLGDDTVIVGAAMLLAAQLEPGSV